MPRARARLRELGAPHGTAAPGAWEPIPALGQQAQQLLDQATTLSDAQRKRLAEAFTAALCSHGHIRKQSTRLTQGKKLRHCKLVNAYDLTIAPILKGKSNCPAQFGRKPGIASEPALRALSLPTECPREPERFQLCVALARQGPKRHRPCPATPKPLRVHSVAGDLGINDAALRQALHARGILTVGIPKTVEPIAPNPSAEEVRDILNEAGLHRKRTLTKCSWLVPVALVARWWKVTSPAYSLAVPVRCVTKVFQALCGNRA